MSKQEKALTKRQGVSGSLEIQSLDDVARVADMIMQSGLFDDVKSAEQAGVKIIAGLEIGVPPMAAQRSIHVFDGNTTLSGPLLASLIKQHPRYDYRPRQVNSEGAKIAFFENGEEVGSASFTKEDAKRANLLRKRNWRQYPADMYMWRALARGQRWYCPDVGSGPLYVPDEMGVETDDENNPVDVGEARVVDETPDPEPAPPQGPQGDTTPSEPAPQPEPAPASTNEQAPEDQPTWRGEAVSNKQLGALRRIEERLSSATSYADLFSLGDELREYASKKPDAWGERVTTLIREAEVAQHGDDVLTDEVLEVARNCGGKVLSRHLGILEQHYGDAWSDVKWQALPWSVTAHLQRCSEKAHAESIVRQALQHCAEGEAKGHYTEQERARAESIIAEAAYHLHDIDVDALEQAGDSETGGDLFEEPEHNDEG